MTRLFYILREVRRSITRNPGTSMSALLSLTLLFLLFNIFWVAARTSDQLLVDIVSNVTMEVFLPEEVSDSAVVQLADTLQNLPGVVSASYISKDLARQELSNLVGVDLLVGYDSLNPLPRSFVMTFEPKAITLAQLTSTENEVKRLAAGVTVQYSRDWLESAEGIRKLIRQIGLVLGILIVLAVVVSSANNIRLMSRVRGVAFRQMLLLGADPLLIAWPYMLEGFILAGVSAVVAWGLTLWGQSKVTFTQFSLVLPPISDISLFCLAAALMGAFSGYLGVRRTLRE